MEKSCAFYLKEEMIKIRVPLEKMFLNQFFHQENR